MPKQSKTPNPTKNIALIVFGHDNAKRPHAATFVKEEAELAERAAAKTNMKALRVTTDEQRALASELAAGRVHASGSAHLPFCAQGTFARLEALDNPFEPKAAEEKDATKLLPTRVPASWADIKKGDVVLAADEVVWGWYEAEVVDVRNGIFELKWLIWPDLPPIVRRSEHLSLMSAAALEAMRGYAGDG